MNKCRYIPISSLSSLKASDEHIQSLLNAIHSRQIKITGSAARRLEDLWRMRIPAFIYAIQSHLETGKSVYQKRVPDPPKNQKLFHANVRLDPTSLDEDDDVYVEIRLCDGIFVLVCDSHPHFDSPRLPK